MSKQRNEPTLESIKARVKVQGDCWIWQGYLQNNTPQVVSYKSGKKSMVSVRKLLRELLSGQPQPSGHYANTCGHHDCVAPMHTIWRQEKSHMRSMAKNRKVSYATIEKIRKSRQELGFAKLNEEQATEIRHSDLPSRELAEKFGVCKSTIGKIKRGAAWRLLMGPFVGLFKK